MSPSFPPQQVQSWSPVHRLFHPGGSAPGWPGHHCLLPVPAAGPAGQADGHLPEPAAGEPAHEASQACQAFEPDADGHSYADAGTAHGRPGGKAHPRAVGEGSLPRLDGGQVPRDRGGQLAQEKCSWRGVLAVWGRKRNSRGEGGKSLLGPLWEEGPALHKL